MIDISKTHTETNTEKIFNADTDNFSFYLVLVRKIIPVLVLVLVK